MWCAQQPLTVTDVPGILDKSCVGRLLRPWLMKSSQCMFTFSFAYTLSVLIDTHCHCSEHVRVSTQVQADRHTDASWQQVCRIAMCNCRKSVHPPFEYEHSSMQEAIHPEVRQVHLAGGLSILSGLGISTAQCRRRYIQRYVGLPCHNQAATGGKYPHQRRGSSCLMQGILSLMQGLIHPEVRWVTFIEMLVAVLRSKYCNIILIET
jgi:hypothetical protein